jgi:hypothetical protein
VASTLDFASSIKDLACDAIPDPAVVTSPIGIGGSIKWSPRDFCADVGDIVSESGQFISAVEYGVYMNKFAENSAADCDAVQEGFQRVYCDLYCIEDAVKKGDKSILDSIGNLYAKMQAMMKEMFVFFTGQSVTQLMGAVSQLEGNLYNRFDGISAEIADLSTNVDTRADVTTGELDKKLAAIITELEKKLDVATGTVDGKVDAIKTKVGALVQLKSSFADASAANQALFDDLRYHGQRGTVGEHSFQEMRNLHAHMRQHLSKNRAQQNITVEAAGEVAVSMAARINNAHSRIRLGGEHTSTPKRAKLRSDEGLHLIDRTLEASQLRAQHVRQKLATLQTKQNELRQSVGFVDPRDASDRLFAFTQRVRGLKQEDHSLALLHIAFDEHWVALMRGMEDFLEATDAHHAVARASGDIARAYMECQAQHQSYDALLLQYKNLQARRSGVESALRGAFKELATRLTALANVLVDGGLLQSELSQETLGEPATQFRAQVEMSGEAKDLFAPKAMAVMLEYVKARSETSVSARLMQQTKAAFDMAEELVLRHRDFGIREDNLQIVALQRAWEQFAGESTKFSPAQMLAELLHKSLPHLAPVPRGCESEAGVVVWGKLTTLPNKENGETLLLLDPSFLLAPVLGRGWRLEMADPKVQMSLNAKVCEKGASNASAWALRDATSSDEISICDMDVDQAQPCTFRASTWSAERGKVP